MPDAPSPAFEVRRADARELHGLRRRVLRADNPESSVQDPRDDEASALHFGGFLDGRLVASASWFRSDPPVNVGLFSYQLRYMAVDPDVQGRGYGSVLLARAMKDLRALGVEQLWANARDSALGFYVATGWTPVAGSQHLSRETRLPHTVIFMILADSSPVVSRNDAG